MLVLLTCLAAMLAGGAAAERAASPRPPQTATQSPWYNFFEEIRVEPFTRKDAEELIERPIRGIFRLDRGVTDRIIEASASRPYLIQKVCIALVNRLHEEKRRRATLADVEAVSLPLQADLPPQSARIEG